MSYVSKPLEFFRRKLDEYRQQAGHFVSAASVKSTVGLLQSWPPHRKVQKTSHQNRGAKTPGSIGHGHSHAS